MTEAIIDLVAVSYNAPAELILFLDSIREHVNIPFTLTVIDNNSPDKSVLPIIQKGLEEIRDNPYCVKATPRYHTVNVGYAKAINEGILPGDAPIVAALNCDVQFMKRTCGALLNAFYSHGTGTVGIMGPRTTDEHNRFTHAGIVFDGKRDGHRFWLQQDVGQADDILEVPTVSGATYFARRECWEDLSTCPTYLSVAPEAQGAFLPTKHFYEETWCSYHARAHNWRVQYRGDIKMIHSWHRSSPIGSQDISGPEQEFRAACAAHDIKLDW